VALKPDDQYEYKTCLKCGQSKKVLPPEGEPLWYWEEWIKSNELLSSREYDGMCMVCTRDALDYNFRMSVEKRYVAQGKPVPAWVWGERTEPTIATWYNAYKEMHAVKFREVNNG